ncbi:hypothetical protein [Terricaulis sp.]|nr:hypothetical protein [Terricaulis sp.]MDZ4693150.1 hypothetical protein [Terricaulis sp.]
MTTSRDTSAEQLRFLDGLGKEITKLAEAEAVMAAATRILGEHLEVGV